MKIAPVLMGGLLGVGALAWLGCDDHHRKVVVVREPAPRPVVVERRVIVEPPPPVVVERRVVVAEPPPPVVVERRPAEVIVVREAPPPIRVERRPPAPSPNHVWIGGYYTYNHGYVWVSGHYVTRPHRDSEWVSDRWEKTDRGHKYVPGHWSR